MSDENTTPDSDDMACPSKSDIGTKSDGSAQIGSSDDLIQESDVKLSKNALKRLRRKEKFDKAKVYKRQQEREKRRRRHAEAREQGISLGPSRKALKRNKMADSCRSETIVIDCDFDELMSERDIYKLVNQVQRCYSINRRCSDPVQLYATSIKSKTLTRLESVGDYKGWDINFTDKNYTEVFSKEKIVYLSSESDNVLNVVKDDEVYIIGGLVDHNHHKGLCYRLAEEKGLRHARLPIDEYVKLQSRKVLTIDQVFHILVTFLDVGKWEEAFYHVIPKRKGIEALKGNGQDEEHDDCNDGNGNVCNEALKGNGNDENSSDGDGKDGQE